MNKPTKVLFYVLLVLAAFLVFFPILYALMISFMGSKEILQGSFFPSLFTLITMPRHLTDYH